jgi:uncharacterized membrane protein YkvA (DUF1232 family)
MIRLFRLWRLGGHDLRLLWYALRHRSRPLWLLPVVAVLGIYALEPLNFAMPLLGVVDDFILLPLLLHWIVKFLPADIHYGFERRPVARR